MGRPGEPQVHEGLDGEEVPFLSDRNMTVTTERLTVTVLLEE
jgi:hypothetical protein